jgi:hypothetical protein
MTDQSGQEQIGILIVGDCGIIESIELKRNIHWVASLIHWWVVFRNVFVVFVVCGLMLLMPFFDHGFFFCREVCGWWERRNQIPIGCRHSDMDLALADGLMRMFSELFGVFASMISCLD